MLCCGRFAGEILEVIFSAAELSVKGNPLTVSFLVTEAAVAEEIIDF